MWTINLYFKQTPVNWQLSRRIVSFYSRYGQWVSGGISGRGLMYESTTSIQAILRVGHHRQINEPFSRYELPDRVVCRIQGPWFGGKQVGKKRSWETSRQSRPRSTDHYLDVRTKLKKYINDGPQDDTRAHRISTDRMEPLPTCRWRAFNARWLAQAVHLMYVPESSIKEHCQCGHICGFPTKVGRSDWRIIASDVTGGTAICIIIASPTDAHLVFLGATLMSRFEVHLCGSHPHERV